MLDVLGAGAMLGDTHAIADDRRLGGGVDPRHVLQVGLTQSARVLDVAPSGCIQVRDQRLEARGMLGDEAVIEDRFRPRLACRVLERQQGLADAFDRGGVATNLDQEIVAGDRR